jgi:type III secretion protein N (ATPase)
MSRSRLFNDVATLEHRGAAGKLRELYSRYQDLELLIQVGEYKKGADKLNDEAVQKIDRIKAFLRQRPGEIAPFDVTMNALTTLADA